MHAESLLVNEGHSHIFYHLAAVSLILFDVQLPVARGAVTQPHSLCCCQVRPVHTGTVHLHQSDVCLQQPVTNFRPPAAQN